MNPRLLIVLSFTACGLEQSGSSSDAKAEVLPCPADRGICEDQCAIDADCDDGLTCSVDRCVPDAYSNLVCDRDRATCKPCWEATECPHDDDPCTTEICHVGACDTIGTDLCGDRRCDPDAETPEGFVHLSGTPEPSNDCGCACTSGVMLDGVMLDTDPPATCTPLCPESSAVRCEPLANDVAWEVYARETESGAEPLHWCVSPQTLFQDHTWDIRFQLGADPAMNCQGNTIAGQELDFTLFVDFCTPCPECRFQPNGNVALIEAGPFVISASHSFTDIVERQGSSPVRWLLVPTATGYRGIVQSSDGGSAAPIHGTVEMDVKGL